MAYRYTFLTEHMFPETYRTFMEAFADYHVDASQVTERHLASRAVKNAVEFESSVGVFHGDKMIGFTLVGIDRWNNTLAAFDAGTGVVPAHRGKGIAGKMFDFALPRLKERGVREFVLEVIQANEAAVKAYQKAGFHITREFDCFTLEVDRFQRRGDAAAQPEVRPIARTQLGAFEEQVDWQPSWENSFASIERVPDRLDIYGAFVEGRCVGEVVYYPLLNWIMSLVVHRDHRRRGAATTLLAHLTSNLPSNVTRLKLHNVERTDEATHALLARTGFDLVISQYEMSRPL